MLLSVQVPRGEDWTDKGTLWGGRIWLGVCEVWGHHTLRDVDPNGDYGDWLRYMVLWEVSQLGGVRQRCDSQGWLAQRQ